MEKEFYFRNGLLHVENMNVRQICANQKDVEPMFIYSKNKIISNVQQYKNELEKQSFSWTLNYSMKANANPTILKVLKETGCSLTLVSGMELKLAFEMGFPTDEIVLNGNGKQIWEIKMAIESGVLLNIDSVFNLKQTIDVCTRLNKFARVLLRVNPDIEVDVHQHVCTGKKGSKFGLDEIEFEEVVSAIRKNSLLKLVGLHCHLGSTIENVGRITESCATLVKMFNDMRNEFDSLKYLNIGGGLGIGYKNMEYETLAWKTLEQVLRDNLGNIFHEFPADSAFQPIVHRFVSNKISAKEFMDMIKTCEGRNPKIVERIENCLCTKTLMPTPADLIQNIKPYIDDDVHLILEPGRSLIGDAAILLCSVLGEKKNGDKNFLVANGAMTEVIRPSMYGAYHHIELAEPVTTDKKVYDVVGPVCESGDFLGKDRLLRVPHPGCLLAVFDVGAYCSSMSMTYNMRRRPVELMVDGEKVYTIRRADTYEDLIAPYTLSVK